MATDMAELNDITHRTGDSQHNKKKDMEFSLTEDEMKKINYLGKLERRKHKSKGLKDLKQNKFSDQLSLEAQIAMQLALKDTLDMKKRDADADRDDGVASRTRSGPKVKFADEQNIPQLVLNPARPDTQCSKHSSFSDVFEKRSSLRMSCDLTGENFASSSVSKRSLDGMKVENALEVVEIVNHDDRQQRRVVDDDAIEQIAKRNSVEKCLVWMEVLGTEGSGVGEGGSGGHGSGPQLPRTAGRSAGRGHSEQRENGAASGPAAATSSANSTRSLRMLTNLATHE